MPIEPQLATEFRTGRGRRTATAAKDIRPAHLPIDRISRRTTIPATSAATRESLRMNPDSEAGATNKGKTVSTSQVNSQTFNALFSKYRSVLYSVAHRMLRNHREAEDAVQHCFLSARANTPEFDCEREFRSWLVRVLMDEALTTLHARSLRSHSALDVLLHSLDGSFGGSVGSSFDDSLDVSPAQGAALPCDAGPNTLVRSYGWY
jgi:hypothetical protein